MSKSKLVGLLGATIALTSIPAAGLRPDPIPSLGPADALLRGRPAPSGLTDCPEIGRPLRGSRVPLTCSCPAIDRDMLGTSVWGSETYTDDSNICLAAIHDGRVTTEGGRITVWSAPGQAHYAAASRNGITSWSYLDFEGSFRFTPPGSRALAAAPGADRGEPHRAAPAGEDHPAAARAAPVGEDYPLAVRARTSLADCPEIGRPLRGTREPLTCTCPAIDREMLGTSVWGNRTYTDDSNICLAAIHDGRISTEGGRIMVWAAPGQARYTAATRNGITSWSYLDFEGSFRFTPPRRRAR